MNSEKCPTYGGDDLVLLLPFLALFGALVGIGICKKHHHEHAEHRERRGGQWAHHSHDHECQCGHGGHFDHEQWRSHAQGPRRRGFDPMRILDKRFAAGEIDEDEYLHRRTVLRENA